jgi:hypothetical protein
LTRKLAINKKGIAQNRLESQNGHDSNLDSIIPKYYGELSDEEKYTYIVTEYVIPCEKEDFKEVLGIDYYVFDFLVRKKVNFETGIKGWKDLTQEEDDLIYDQNFSDFPRDLIEYCIEYNVNPLEVTAICNLGMCKRNGKVTIVLLDNGFNEDIYMQYYKK